MKRLITKSPFYTHIIGAVFIALFGVALYVAATPPVRADDTSVAAGEHIIALHDDGAVKGFITKKATLKEALADANVAIDANDRTEPALDTKLVANSYQVNIYRARPVVIKDGLAATKVITSYRTGAQIAKHAGLVLHDEDKAELSQSTSPLGDGASEIMTVTRATPFTFDFYGKTSTSYSLGKTVGDMLNRKHITLAQNDVVVPGVDTPLAAGLHVRLYREGTQTITQEEEVPFETEKIKDANQPASYKEVKTAGKKGKRTVTYEIKIENGVEVSRKEVNSNVTEQPVKQVEVVGAKFNYTGGPLNEAQITALGVCETGMTATRNSGNGFYGAFQFMPGTWQSNAPAEYKGVLPHQAPLEAQKQAVQNLLSRSSIYTQFPGCARKMQAQGVL